MRRTSIPACFGLVLFCIFVSPLLNSRFALHSQAPAAGTSVAVKMLDAVDSQSDPAGKQYRASVTKAINAGNGVSITQGAAATVTLAMNGSTWVAQLTSVVINGQAVAVSSSSASVTSATGAAANAVSSVLGGFGHHAPAPTSVTAIASGKRVLLPPGTTLNFVLADPAPANTPPAAASAAPVAQPPAASAAPAASSAPAPASSSAAASSGNVSAGPLTAMNICFAITPAVTLDPSTMYLTAAFEVPVNTQGSIPVFQPAFSDYLKTTYHYTGGITCQPIWSINDAKQAQAKLTDDRDRGKVKVINTGWRYQQPALSPGQSGFDPLATGPGGLDLSQHRLTTYFCSLTALGGTSMAKTDPALANMKTYVSSIFEADWDSASVSMAYNVYIRDHFVHDLNLSDLSPRCVAQSPALEASMHQSAMISNKRTGQAVGVDWTYTPEQATAAHVATAAAAPSTASTASSAGGPFISCATSGGAGIDTYLTGVFQTKLPVKRWPNGGVSVDQSILDRFYAYLTSKGYNFKPGSNSGCDVKPTEAEAKAAQHKRHYEGGGCSTCGKTVETGWKDTQ